MGPSSVPRLSPDEGFRLVICELISPYLGTPGRPNLFPRLTVSTVNSSFDSPPLAVSFIGSLASIGHMASTSTPASRLLLHESRMQAVLGGKSRILDLMREMK